MMEETFQVPGNQILNELSRDQKRFILETDYEWPAVDLIRIATAMMDDIPIKMIYGPDFYNLVLTYKNGKILLLLHDVVYRQYTHNNFYFLECFFEEPFVHRMDAGDAAYLWNTIREIQKENNHEAH